MKKIENDIKNYLAILNVSISKEIIKTLTSIIKKETIKANEFLVKPGEYQKDFFIIKSGLLRSYYLNSNGKEVTREFFKEGSICGSNAAMMRKKTSEMYYQAITDAIVYKGDFYKLLELTKVSHDISLLYTKAIEYYFLMTESHVIRLISLSSEEHYKKLQQKIPNVDKMLAQKHIASYLNITPVQLSRIKKKLLSEN